MNPHPLNEETIKCFCGSTASMRSNSVIYGREYGNGKMWICDRFPACEGRVGTHPDGTPLGKLGSKLDLEYRKQVHAQIDPLWKDLADRSKKRNRGSVYGWLRRIMNMTPDECHVGNWNAETCIEALEQIAAHPYKEKYTGGES